MSIEKTTKLTPNLKRLLIECMSTVHINRARATSVPPGEFGLAGAIAAGLVAGGKNQMAADAEQARVMVNAGLSALRMAGEPNPYKDATDEEIAGAILDAIAKKGTVAS